MMCWFLGTSLLLDCLESAVALGVFGVHAEAGLSNWFSSECDRLQSDRNICLVLDEMGEKARNNFLV